MCGITFASFSDASCINIREIARTLLLGVESRGPQATGVAWCNPADGCIDGFNAPVTAKEFVRDPGFRRMSDEARVFIGHTRYATKGSIDNPANNHPVFAWTPEGHTLAAVHNGGVWNDDETFKAHGLPRHAQVDSEVIPAMLARYGSSASAVCAVFGELEGGIATAWLDDRAPLTLHAVRAQDSPMVIVTIDVQTTTGPIKGVVGASTASALTSALKVMGLDWDSEGVTQYEIGEGEFFTVLRGEWDGMVQPFALPEMFSSYGSNWRSRNASTQGSHYGYGSGYSWASEGSAYTGKRVSLADLDSYEASELAEHGRVAEIEGYTAFYNKDTGTTHYVPSGGERAAVLAATQAALADDLADGATQADRDWWETEMIKSDLVSLGNRMACDPDYRLSLQDQVVLDMALSADVDIEGMLGLPSEALDGSDRAGVTPVGPDVSAEDTAMLAQVEAVLATAAHISHGTGWPIRSGPSAEFEGSRGTIALL